MKTQLNAVYILRRLPIVVFDGICALTFGLLLLMALPQPALAYVDPSVMTYTIQAIAGAAVALGAVLGVALRRTRKFLFRLFKIDENANKVVDPTVHPIEEDGQSGERLLDEADDRARQVTETLTNGKPVKVLSWPKRFVRALIGCTFLVWTIFVFTPLELVSAGSGSLQFGFFEVTGLVIGVGIGLALGLALLVSIVRGRAFDILLTVIVAVGLCCYIQSLVLNFSLPAADGRPFDLSHYKRMTIISTVVWAAVIAALLLFNAKKKPYSRTFVLVISVLLFAVQGISMITIANGEAQKANGQSIPITESNYGINEVGAAGDVTVFVLDTFDTYIMDDLLEKDPQILDEYTGFTYFRNSVGSMIPTRYGVPFLLTDVMPQPGDNYFEFMDTIYDRSRLLSDIRDQGYEITIYSDSFNFPKVEPYAENIFYESDRHFDQAALWVSLEKMALFREMPWLLKPFFWFYTDQLNANLTDNYVMDDIHYGATLRDEGLSVSENADKTFRFIHLLGSHLPYIMDAEGNRVSEEQSSELIQTQGCLGFVTDYLRELKRLGLYDQSMIIVTADHGKWTLTMGPLDEPSSPVLLVKPPETPQQAAEPLQVSEAPTGHQDIAATIIAAVGGDSSAYGPTVFQVPDEPRDRYYWMLTHDGHIDHEWMQYLIQGHVLDFDSWHLTGEKIEIEYAP